MKREIKSGINVMLKPLHVNENPIHIQLEPTTACNLSCLTCPHEEYIKRARHMPLDDFKRIIDQIRPLKITLSGLGEPFANPKLPEMIAYAKDSGASVNTTSNMTLIDEKLAERIVRSRLDLIKVSIDAANPETYRHIRGEDCHGQVIEGVERISRVKKERGAGSPSLRSNFVVQGRNFREMADFVVLAADIGVEAVYFQPLELTGIEQKRNEILGGMTKEALQAELGKAREAADAADMETNLSAFIDSMDVLWKKYDALGSQQGRRICLLPWFSTYITVDGDVRPCCSFPINPEANQGNILRENFMDIWNGEKYRQFRKAIREGERPFRICRNCVPRTLWEIAGYSRLLPGFIK